MVFESVGGLSELVRKILKRIAPLTDNRRFHSAGLSFAFSRLAESVSVTLMRGKALMCRPVSQQQAKEASLMSCDFWLKTRRLQCWIPIWEPDCVGFSIPIENPIKWVPLFQLKTRLYRFYCTWKPDCVGSTNSIENSIVWVLIHNKSSWEWRGTNNPRVAMIILHSHILIELC